MYLKDKNHRVTVRFTDDQFYFVTKTAEIMGISPSDVIRQFVNMSMFAARKSDSGDKIYGGGKGRENDITTSDDIV